MTKYLLGKPIADTILQTIADSLKQPLPRRAQLACILVGDNPSSHTYVSIKRKRCEEVGIIFAFHHHPTAITTQQLLDLISSLNQDPNIDGILIQQPLPSHIEVKKVLEAISPEKDVDGFSPINLGKLVYEDDSGIAPCTPLGVCLLLRSYGISLEGKNVVIVGRSTIVGKPLALLMAQKKEGMNATVSLAHSQTRNIGELIARADVVVAAMGSPHFIKKEMIKEGAVVIDVGITKVDGVLMGDVEPSVSEKTSWITPVPGGVGPMTVALLLQNTVTSFFRSIQKPSSPNSERSV